MPKEVGSERQPLDGVAGTANVVIGDCGSIGAFGGGDTSRDECRREGGVQAILTRPNERTSDGFRGGGRGSLRSPVVSAEQSRQTHRYAIDLPFRLSTLGLALSPGTQRGTERL
jgi:hypothetical protein